MSYDEVKTAQAAAYLIRRAGGTMPFLSLIKLLYLSERLSLERYGYPITGDHLVSMDHGPVLSRTYDHIKGARLSGNRGWDSWVADQANYMVGLTKNGKVGDLDDLSESDQEVLEEVWAQFGDLSRWQLVDYTHTLPEWEQPNGTSIAIDLLKLLTNLGYSDQAAEHLIEQMRHQRVIDNQFA